MADRGHLKSGYVTHQVKALQCLPISLGYISSLAGISMLTHGHLTAARHSSASTFSLSRSPSATSSLLYPEHAKHMPRSRLLDLLLSALPHLILTTILWDRNKKNHPYLLKRKSEFSGPSKE